MVSNVSILKLLYIPLGLAKANSIRLNRPCYKPRSIEPFKNLVKQFESSNPYEPSAKKI